jgi:hypothetical protein
MSITTRMQTIDDIAAGTGSGDITRRAPTMAGWETLDGQPMGTYDDLATVSDAEPIPDPVADFAFAPTAATTADVVTFDGSIATPADHIVAYEWTQLMPSGGDPAEGKVLERQFPEVGPMVMQLTVRLADGRSHYRSRGVNIVEAE